MSQENTKLLHCFLENALEAIIIWDKDGRIIQTSTSVKEVFGYENIATKAAQISRLVPDLAVYHWGNWLGEPLHLELSGINNQGKVFPLEIKIRCIDIEGRALVLGNFKDITDRKFSAVEIEKREKRFSGLFHQAKDAMFIVEPADSNPSGRIVQLNNSALQCFGYTSEDFLKGGFSLLFANSEGISYSQSCINKTLEQGYLLTTANLVNKLGQVFYSNLSLRIILYRGIKAILVVVRDITDKKQQFDELTKTVNDLQELSNSIPALIWRTGADGKCQYANENWTAFTGRSLQEEIGIGWIDRVHPEDMHYIPLGRISSSECRNPFNFEGRFLRHDGEYRWLKVIANPHFMPSGDFAGYIGCCFDITAQKENQTSILLINNVAMQVLEEKPTSEILQYLCSALVDMFNLALVWVGLNEKGKNFAIKVHSGTATQYLNRLRNRWDKIPWEYGPAGIAIKTGLCHTFEVKESGQHPWWAEAYRDGIRSTAALPLVIKGEVLGVIAFYSRTENFFNTSRLAQLESIAGQVAIALNDSFIRQRLRLLHTALEAADNAVMILDREMKIQWVNQAFIRITGFTKEEVLGGHPSLFCGGLNNPNFYRGIFERIYAGKVWKGEINNKRKNGTPYTVESTITPVRDETGVFINFIEIHQDITERKQEEEKLQQYKVLFKRAQNIIFLIGQDGSFIEANEATTEVYGYTTEELKSMKAQDLRVPGTYPNVDEQLMIADERGIIYETIHRKKDGSTFPVEVALQSVEIGQEKFIISVIWDLTEMKREEADKIKALQRVEKAERLASLGTMVAGIAHEINQPLNALRMLADGTLYLSQKGKISDNMVSQNLSKVSEQVNRIDEIIRHMRMLIGRETQQELEPCCLNQAVQRALDILSKQIITKGIIATTCLADNLPKCLGIANRFEEIVLNLLNNAIQALEMTNQKVKEIDCTTLVEDEYLVLKIKDNGPGIPRDLQTRVFEPFFTNKPVGVGMGLGLTIVDAIISSYQGQINVQDNEPQGTIVIIKLPFNR